MENLTIEQMREMLSAVKEVGGMPFALFQYYLTCVDEEGRIKPGLQQIADDLGLTKPAICNLRAKLVAAKWIELDGDEVFIHKSFTKNERTRENHSQKMNETEKSFTKNERNGENRSQKMNDTPESFTKNERYSQKMNDFPESFTKNERIKENHSQKMNENSPHNRNIKDLLHQENNLNGGGGLNARAPALESAATAAMVLTEAERKMSKADFQAHLKTEFAHLEDVQKSINECVLWYQRTKNKPPNRLQVKKWLADEYEDFDVLTENLSSPETRRAAVKACNRCDANGYILVGNSAKVCNHEGAKN